MKNKILKLARIIKLYFMRIVNVFKIYKIVFDKTYYPEVKRKSVIKRFFENFIWTIKYGELNNFYNLYGFDVKLNKDKSEYIDYFSFMRDRNKLNNLDEKYNYVVLLRDKFIFEKYFKSNKINTATNIGIIVDGIIYDTYFNEINKIEDVFKKIVFIKNVDGECADGVYRIKNINDYLNKNEKFKKGKFIIQEEIIQHEKMNKLNPKSVNTIRIVTVRNKDKIEILCSGLRCGTARSNNVDNWAAGGLYIEIDEKGKLTKYGFAKPKYGGKTEIHPDTNIKFLGYQVPKYSEVIELVKKAHKTLYGIHSIGWDVAITDNGPILIEGNDNWEISLMQVNRGLKKKWKETLK